MSHQDDKYDFSLPSISGQPGFDCFEKNGSHFFLYNDEAGKPFLFSQAYKSEKSRDKGLQSVMVNATKKSRTVKEKTDSGKPYFILKAGNSLEIARSHPFDTIKDMETKIKLLAAINSKTPVHPASADAMPATPAKETEVKETVVLKTKKETSAPSRMPKYSFRIDWYPESESGRIEHLVSGDAKRFKGVDKESIIGFLTDHLPVEKPAQTAAQAPAARPRIPAGYKISGIEDETIKDIVLKVKGQECKGTTSGNLSDWSLELNVQDLIKDKSRTCSAAIFAKSLSTSQQEFLGQLEQMVPVDGKMSVPLSSGKLKPGPYRLIARVSMKNGETTAEGSRLVQIW